MTWVTRSGVALALVAAGVAIVGWLLPQDHEAARSADFDRPADEVYALVADFRSYPAWWPDITRVEVMVEASNRTTFREYRADGPVIMTVVEAAPSTRFVTKVDDADQSFGGTWTFEVTPIDESRARLTLTERGEIYNPLARFLARFVSGYTGPLDRCLAAAQDRLAR